MAASLEPTAAAYQATAGSFLDIDRAFYAKVHEDPRKELVDSFILPIRSGRAWKVPAGHLCRITIPEGPQVSTEACQVAGRKSARTATCHRLWSGGRPELVELQRPP